MKMLEFAASFIGLLDSTPIILFGSFFKTIGEPLNPPATVPVI